MFEETSHNLHFHSIEDTLMVEAHSACNQSSLQVKKVRKGLLKAF